jgi:uncharacterized protein YxjI
MAGDSRQSGGAVDVTIQEHRFSLTAEYDIEAPNGSMFAHRKFFSIPAQIELTSGREGGQTIATMQGEFSFLRSRYEFHFADGREYRFECEKLLKQVYVCEREGERHELIEHHGLRSSIFRDDRQIAAITKNRLVVGNGNQYDIRMNSDADVAVIACMVIAVNTADGDDRNQETVTFNLGNIGPQERPFDERWEPS